MQRRALEQSGWMECLRTEGVELVLIDAPDQLARLCANTLEKTTRRFLDRTLRTDCPSALTLRPSRALRAAPHSPAKL